MLRRQGCQETPTRCLKGWWIPSVHAFPWTCYVKNVLLSCQELVGCYGISTSYVIVFFVLQLLMFSLHSSVQRYLCNALLSMLDAIYLLVWLISVGAILKEDFQSFVGQFQFFFFFSQNKILTVKCMIVWIIYSLHLKSVAALQGDTCLEYLTTISFRPSLYVVIISNYIKYDTIACLLYSLV